MSEPECCRGTPYHPDVVGRFLGDSWHPGGSALTSRLALQTIACDDALVLDVGCGAGATSRLLSEQFGCRVVGMDVSPANAGNAFHRSAKKDLTAFLAGDGQHIPLARQTFDGVVLECTFSTFHDKPAAIGEFARVLKTKGRLGMSDVVVEGDIPEELKSPLMDALCVGGALSVDGYQDLLRREGFRVVNAEKRRQETLDFLEEIKRKLFVAKLLAGIGRVRIDPQDLVYAHHLLSLAIKAADEEKLGYAILVAEKNY